MEVGYMRFIPGNSSVAALAAAGVSVCLALVPIAAQAISRYNPTTMPCSAIQATVASQGAVILRWTQPPRNILRFDRYVAGNQFCDTEERVKLMSVPAADTPQCPVYACRHFEPLFGLDSSSSGSGGGRR
jgi:hypothetical protein